MPPGSNNRADCFGSAEVLTLPRQFVKLSPMTGVQTETGVLAGEERMLIEGELQFTSSGGKFAVIPPASGQVAGQAADGTVADMERAVGAARRAFDAGDWSRDLDFRYHCLTQLAEALERNKERLRRVVITEVGCPVTVSG